MSELPAAQHYTIHINLTVTTNHHHPSTPAAAATLMLSHSILPILLVALIAALTTLLLTTTTTSTPQATATTTTTTFNHTRIMSTKMRAVLHKAEGCAATDLHIGEADKPQVQPDHILIRVKAFGLNRADIQQRLGKYPPPPGASSVLGLECSGEIAEVGPSSSSSALSLPQYKVGDRVMALLTGGGYAEYALAHTGTVIPLPADWSYEHGAACVEVFVTSYQLMRYIGKVQAGEVVLIHAGASGIGSAAIQLAHLFGAKAIVTAGSQDKLDYCTQLGADAAFNYKDSNWLTAVQTQLKAWNKSGVDVILDPVIRSHAQHNLALLALDSRWLIFGAMSGTSVAEGFELGVLLRKRASIVGTTLRGRSAEYKAALVGEVVREVYTALVEGRVKVTIDTVYGWERIVEAHQHMEEDRTKGKVVCTVS